MLQTIEHAQRMVIDRIEPEDIRRAISADDSPFGIQGLARETLKILKPECINAFAATLALRGTPEQIRDPQFVAQLLSRNEGWQNEFRVVHLIEKSLWIDGHSDLVMTMTKNPSRILDDPPREILDAMSVAIAVHPQSTIWYGVPLFGEETNDDGLPIPLTASEVRAEAARRIAQAQQHALRWRWAYRAALRYGTIPWHISSIIQSCKARVRRTSQAVVKYWQRAKRDARNRERARILAESEYCRRGCSFTRIPAHTTLLGRMAEQTTDSIRNAGEAVSNRMPGLEGMVPVLTGTATVLEGLGFIATISPILMSPLPIMACDPFLFVELPHEPDRLRFLGHWYWQEQPRGKTKLHLHAPL